MQCDATHKVCALQRSCSISATPDGVVYNPSCSTQPFGFLETKSPFKHKNVTLLKACHTSVNGCTFSILLGWDIRSWSRWDVLDLRVE